MSEPILKTIYPASLVFKKHSVPKSRLFKICWDRALLLIRRNAFFYVFKTIQIIVVALIVSTVYLRTEMHAKVENDAALYIGALIYSMIANMFNGFAELPLMIQRLAVFYKQRDLLFHPPWTFTLPIWKELAPMNKPRHNFASAEVDGLVYVIRGFSRDGATLYNGEVYNPKTNQWRDFDCPNRPQWFTFAFSFGSKLNVVGDQVSLTYMTPKRRHGKGRTWGQSWVGYSYTVLRNKVYFVDMCWSEYLRVFDPHDHSWSMVRLPPNYQGLMYKLDTWNNKVLLLSWHRGGVTLMYDSDEEEGSKWNVFDQMEPSARPLASVISVIINF